MHRRNQIILVISACILIAFAVLEVRRLGAERDALAAARPYDTESLRQPLRLPIPFLYQHSTAPSPSRRVIPAGAYEIRDTIQVDRPVTLDGAATHMLPEGLVFLRDSVTGDKMAVLTRLDRNPSEWVEIMPLPADPTEISHVHRWTPLGHTTAIWHPGWAEMNGPGKVVWLGLDSSIVRYHDLLSTKPPYRVARHITAGRPGPQTAPAYVSVSLILSGVLGILCLIGAALFEWKTRRD